MWLAENEGGIWLATEFLVEQNAFVNPATPGKSKKSTYKYSPVHTQMQTSSQMKSVLLIQV